MHRRTSRYHLQSLKAYRRPNIFSDYTQIRLVVLNPGIRSSIKNTCKTLQCTTMELSHHSVIILAFILRSQRISQPKLLFSQFVLEYYYEKVVCCCHNLRSVSSIVAKQKKIIILMKNRHPFYIRNKSAYDDSHVKKKYVNL